MKCRVVLSFILLCLFFISALPANSQENQCTAFIDLLQDFHKATTNVQIGMLRSFFLVGEIVHDEPKVEAIKELSQSISEMASVFEEKSKEIQQYIKQNGRNLNISKKTLEKLETDSSDNIVLKVKEFSNALSSFSNSINVTDFTVYATEGWANSGITVNSGDILFVDSKGSWKVSSIYDFVGWKGYICNSSSTYALNNNAPIGSLLYRVRGSSNQNGSNLDEKKRARIDSKGRLEFIINDSDRGNNEGQLDLKVVLVNGEAFTNLIQTIEDLKKSE